MSFNRWKIFTTKLKNENKVEKNEEEEGKSKKEYGQVFEAIGKYFYE